MFKLGLDPIKNKRLTTLLSVVALLASKPMKTGAKGYHAWLLLLEFAVLGVFMAQDWSLFFMFWELTLIPLFFLIDLLAGMGMPGLAGFVAELHVLIGGFQQWGWLMLLASLGVLMSAAYGFRTIGGLFTGPPRPELADVPDLRRWELAAVLPLAAGLLLLGLQPAPLIALMSAKIAELAAVFARLMVNG